MTDGHRTVFQKPDTKLTQKHNCWALSQKSFKSRRKNNSSSEVKWQWYWTVVVGLPIFIQLHHVSSVVKCVQVKQLKMIQNVKVVKKLKEQMVCTKSSTSLVVVMFIRIGSDCVSFVIWQMWLKDYNIMIVSSVTKVIIALIKQFLVTVFARYIGLVIYIFVIVSGVNSLSIIYDQDCIMWKCEFDLIRLVF